MAASRSVRNDHIPRPRSVQSAICWSRPVLGSTDVVELAVGRVVVSWFIRFSPPKVRHYLEHRVEVYPLTMNAQPTPAQDPAAPASGAVLTISALAGRTGVSTAVLRAWESRYGFPLPKRLASGHRR